MNLDRNSTYHFLGIGGVGMAGLAYLLKHCGLQVSGCDKYASARTRWLEQAGIKVFQGHSAAHLDGVDALVITPAVPKSEDELAAARRLGNELPPKCRILTRGETLAELVNLSDGIAVCGTHGKTTTATFTAKLLSLLGTDPSWCIGGECGEMPVARAAANWAATVFSAPDVERHPLVVEADESDGTLAHYRARTLVITSMDYDHPEHFKTQEAYRECFARAEAQSGDVIRAWELDAGDWPQLKSLTLGEHNAMNARAAIEVALRRGYTREQILSVLPQALDQLPDRRFQRIHPAVAGQIAEDFTVYTDYAHHPAELACAAKMAAALKPKRLRVLFQPHRYSRTKALRANFPAAFTAADEVVLIPVYPAFEKPIPGGDIADLYLEFRNHPGAKKVLLARSAEEAWRHVYLTREPGDLVLLAGAGDIIKLVPRILAALSPSVTFPAPPRKSLAAHTFFRVGGDTCGGGKLAIVGQGSNTWFSDCTSDIEVASAPDDPPADENWIPAGIAGAALLKRPKLGQRLAFMAGIPGTLGGWVKMNAGAFGRAIGECIEKVRVQLTDEAGRLTGRIVELAASECGFAYRTSKINGLILAAKFKPDTEAPTANADSIETYLGRRKNFPPRTCGSVFKNPDNGPTAGELLEKAGAKGLRVGGAYVWQDHANVIVAGEGATASDILALARLMAAAVYFKYAIRLEAEIRGLGD